ncbi:hypothetical protein J3R83DRAFT_3507 [Lanmaoa asiatica]|nr:hypothetical protein J3R83DRAFT_3507 [Lanmaoa asiatica]
MIFQYLFLGLALLVLVTLRHVLGVYGYIPAQPSNITVQGTGGVNTSSLHLQWYTNGSDWEYVTQQAVGPEASNDPVQVRLQYPFVLASLTSQKGIFVHFTEDSAGNETTTTPWVAFVSCDANSTNSSQEADIFTMAKNRGAKSAVLYSLYSETCVINPGYQSSVLDVFTTQTLNASWRIEYEFGQFGPSTEEYYGYFNAALLNNAAAVLNDTITFDYPAVPDFLFATLPAYNTGTPNGGLQSDANGTGTSTSTGSSGSQNTGVAMGTPRRNSNDTSLTDAQAVRAIRYPERYGPRSADPTLGGGQSRARGLGRAILDTFPIVKFGSSGSDRESSLPRPKDVESARINIESSIPVPLPDSVQLAQLSVMAEHGEHPHDPSGGDEAREDNQTSEGTGQVDLPTQTVDYAASRIPTSPREIDTRMPECIGRETCPICIVDFEEGDDLRVLPCEGKHRFHQSCVDPWLLELSGSCPICRQDFHALETIISGEPGSEASPINRNSEAATSTTQNRFSRYLRFVRRRQGRPSSRDQGSLPQPES